MHLAQFMADAGVEQDALGGGGLAGVDMGADADVAVTLDGGFASHDNFLLENVSYAGNRRWQPEPMANTKVL
jgi:hypothetical protein